MPHSGYTICTSEQLLTSTAVSHSFVIARYSSPPFGSHGPCNHSEPCPLDFGTGVPCRMLALKTLVRSGHLPWHRRSTCQAGPALAISCIHLDCCLHHITWFADSTIGSACSIDSLVRVSRRAESGTETKLNCHLHCTLAAKHPPQVSHRQDDAASKQHGIASTFKAQCTAMSVDKAGLALLSTTTASIEVLLAFKLCVISLICCPQAQGSLLSPLTATKCIPFLRMELSDQPRASPRLLGFQQDGLSKTLVSEQPARGKPRRLHPLDKLPDS